MHQTFDERFDPGNQEKVAVLNCSANTMQPSSEGPHDSAHARDTTIHCGLPARFLRKKIPREQLHVPGD